MSLNCTAAGPRRAGECSSRHGVGLLFFGLSADPLLSLSLQLSCAATEREAAQTGVLAVTPTHLTHTLTWGRSAYRGRRQHHRAEHCAVEAQQAPTALVDSVERLTVSRFSSTIFKAQRGAAAAAFTSGQTDWSYRPRRVRESEREGELGERKKRAREQ